MEPSRLYASRRAKPGSGGGCFVALGGRLPCLQYFVSRVARRARGYDGLVSVYTPYPRSASEREAAQGPPSLTGVVYAGWWRRAAALLVDMLAYVAFFAAVIAAGFGLAQFDSDAAGIALIFGAIVAITGPVWYVIWAIGKHGQTVGKKALHIRVRHAEEDCPIGYGPSAGRYFITALFGAVYLPALLDYLWPLWDSRNQSLHDKIVNSIVVRV